METKTKTLFGNENNDKKQITNKDIKEVINAYTDKDVDDEEFQFFGKFALNDDWVESFNNELRQPHESYEIELLRDDLYEIFINSDFYEKYSKLRKVPRQDMLKIFLYFFDNIKEKERYTNVEKFIEICNFMEMSYDIVYKELPVLYKQNLIIELDKKFKIFDKHKVHKLF